MESVIISSISILTSVLGVMVKASFSRAFELVLQAVIVRNKAKNRAFFILVKIS
jgi:hypothetical protein